ncbi:hypothetical protein ACSQ67_018027 [Phaseolus vulgaris]
MEAVFEKLNAFTKSGQDFLDGVFRRRNPIEILKRLQREAFSDIMKLRDRQEKVERILSFYQSTKGGPFKIPSLTTGVDSRFIFETTIGEKCSGAAEFVATHGGREHCDEKPLSLSKLSLTANVNDWFSLVAMPVGARGRDVAIASNSFDQVGKGFTDFSYFGPPLLHLHNGTAIGLTLRKSNVIASLAQHVTGMQILHTSSTFGQLVYQFSRGTKLSILGLHRMPLSSNKLGNFGVFTIPIVLSKQKEVSEAAPEVLPTKGTRTLGGSIALMAESEIDGFRKLGGWFEMNKLNPQSVQFGVTICDDSEDSLGWGISLSRFIVNSANEAHFQAESYLKFNMGNKFCLKPGVVLGTDGKSKIAALMLQSNWSL